MRIQWTNGPNGPNCGFRSRPFAFCPMVPKPPNGHRPGDVYDARHFSSSAGVCGHGRNGAISPAPNDGTALHAAQGTSWPSVFKKQQAGIDGIYAGLMAGGQGQPESREMKKDLEPWEL